MGLGIQHLPDPLIQTPLVLLLSNPPRPWPQNWQKVYTATFCKPVWPRSSISPCAVLIPNWNFVVVPTACPSWQILTLPSQFPKLLPVYQVQCSVSVFKAFVWLLSLPATTYSLTNTWQGKWLCILSCPLWVPFWWGAGSLRFSLPWWLLELALWLLHSQLLVAAMLVWSKLFFLPPEWNSLGPSSPELFLSCPFLSQPLSVFLTLSHSSCSGLAWWNLFFPRLYFLKAI